MTTFSWNSGDRWRQGEGSDPGRGRDQGVQAGAGHPGTHQFFSVYAVHLSKLCSVMSVKSKLSNTCFAKISEKNLLTIKYRYEVIFYFCALVNLLDLNLLIALLWSRSNFDPAPSPGLATGSGSRLREKNLLHKFEEKSSVLNF